MARERLRVELARRERAIAAEAPPLNYTQIFRKAFRLGPPGAVDQYLGSTRRLLRVSDVTALIAVVAIALMYVTQWFALSAGVRRAVEAGG